MIKPQGWCIEQIPGEKGWRCIQVRGDNGGVQSFSGISESNNIRSLCKGHIHLCFNPQEYYLYNDEFPQLKPDILDMQIRKHFSDRRLTMEAENFVHRARRIPEKDGWLNCLFVPQGDVTELCSFIQPWKKIRSLLVIPGAAAVASLLQIVTDEAVLVFLLGTTESQVVVVKGGVPLYSQSLTQSGPGKVDEALIPHAVDFARVSVKKDHNIKDFHITRMGQSRKSINLQDIGIEEWRPDFSKVLDPQSQENVLLYPQLFGAAYVDCDYNFLPNAYSTSWRLQLLSSRTSIFATIAGVALLAAWLYLQPLLKEQRILYQTLSTSITEEQQALSRRIPEPATLDTFNRLVKIRTSAFQDFRLDTLAEQLSLALPENVHVTNLKVRRQSLVGSSEEGQAPETGDMYVDDGTSEPGMTDNSVSIPERLQAQDIAISVTCTTSGSYNEVTSRFENVMIALNNFFKVNNMTWNYREADRTGLLNCKLFPKVEVVKQ